MSLAAFGVRNPISASLVKFVMLAAGLTFGLGLRREFFPEVDPTQVLIAAPYPGASPEEVERSLAVKIEDALADLRDVKEVNTQVTSGAAVVRIEFNEGVGIDARLAEVKRKIDALQDLPEQAERITPDKFEPNIPAIVLSLHGDADERTLKEAIQQIRDDLRTLPGMGDITLSGVRADELVVEVRPGALLEHGLSLPQVADRVRQAMIEVPGGEVRSATATIALRMIGIEERAEEVRGIVVKAGSAGQVLRLGEIADVRRGFVDTDVVTRLNGQPCASLTVFKVGKQDAIEIADMVKAYAAGRMREPFAPTLTERMRGVASPGGVPASRREMAHQLGLSRAEPPGAITLTTDLARFIRQRLSLLSVNALQGAGLILLTLILLLNWRAAWWVMIGLSVAMLGSLVLMRVSDITLNLISMFGLILVLGIDVDDAIVITENVVHRHDAGEPALEAAVRGANEVTWPVIGTVITTIVAFLPLLMISGRIGDLFGQLPWVVVCVLVMSLFEALFCLPVHVGHSLERADRRRRAGKVTRFSRFEHRFDHARDRLYERYAVEPFGRFLRLCLASPLTFLCIITSLTIVSVGMVAGKVVPFTFFNTADSETIVADLRMPIGTSIESTDAVVRRLEQSALAQPEVKSVFCIAGFAGDVEGVSSAVQSHLGQLFIELHAVEEREAAGQRRTDQVIVGIRQGAGALAGVKSLRMTALGGGPSGAPITLTVVSDVPGAIDPVAAAIQAELATFEGVFDVADDADRGLRELRISLRPGASELGFTTESLARQVRGAVFGLEPHTFAGVREDVDVRVRLPEATRRNLAAIERLHVFTPAGDAVPLVEVAALTEAQGYATLRRLDRKRAVTITADVNNALTNPEEVMAALRPTLDRLAAENPAVRILKRGRQKDLADSFASLPLGMAFALGLNYAVMAVISRSYVQPLLMMSAIPFAIIGVVMGHLVMGHMMTIASLIGFVALTGIVMNNAIVYIDFYNSGRARGASVADAAVAAGKRRLRPILLTTITTIAGMAPLLMADSFQARVLIPMAITICGGLVSSTVLVLIALPCLLVVMDRVRGLFRGPEPASEAAAVATAAPVAPVAGGRQET